MKLYILRDQLDEVGHSFDVKSSFVHGGVIIQSFCPIFIVCLDTAFVYIESTKGVSR